MVITNTISPLLKFSLQLVGSWPDVPYSSVRRLIHISSILIVQYFQYMYIFAHFRLSELQNLVEGLPATLYYSLAIIKASMLWKSHRVIREVLAAVDTDWRECVNVDRHLRLMMAKASMSNFYSKFFFGFNSLAALLYYMANNVMAIVHETQNDNNTTRAFPVRLLFPFEAERSPVYELLVALLFLHAVVTVYTTTIADVLALTLVLHASGQMDIISRELKSIFKKTPCSEAPIYTIGMLVEKHSKVISFSENLDQIFSFIALMLISWNTLVICFLGLVFLTSNSESSFYLVKTIFAYIGVVLEIFIFCFVGEHLGVKSLSLSGAAYESLWYNMPSSSAKNLLLIMMRSQKQQTITIGGITNLSLEAFTGIMKASVSYMSVFNAMY